MNQSCESSIRNYEAGSDILIELHELVKDTKGVYGSRFRRVALPDAGTNAGQVIDELVAHTAGGHLGSAGGRFFAWVIGGSLPSALCDIFETSTKPSVRFC